MPFLGWTFLYFRSNGIRDPISHSGHSCFNLPIQKSQRARARFVPQCLWEYDVQDDTGRASGYIFIFLSLLRQSSIPAAADKPADQAAQEEQEAAERRSGIEQAA
jgi:hypothetical protein